MNWSWKIPNILGRRSLLLAIGLVIVVVLYSNVPASHIVAAMADIKWEYAVIAVLTGTFTTVVRAARFVLFFPISSEKGFKLYGIFAASRFLAVAMPFRSGEVVSAALVVRNGFAPTFTELSPIWVALRIFDLIALGVIVVVAFLTVPFDAEFAFVPWVVLGTGASALVLLLVAIVWAQRSGPVAGFGRGGHQVEAARNGIRRIRSVPQMFTAGILSLMIWSLMAAVSVLAQCAVDVPLSLSESFLLAVISLAASLLPVHAPGGIGTDDLVWSALLIGSGLSPAAALAAALPIRALLLAPVLLDGVIGAATIGLAPVAVLAPAKSDLPSVNDT